MRSIITLELQLATCRIRKEGNTSKGAKLKVPSLIIRADLGNETQIAGADLISGINIQKGNNTPEDPI